MRKKTLLTYHDIDSIKNVIGAYIDRYSKTPGIVTFLFALKKNSEYFGDYYNQIANKYEILFQDYLKNKEGIPEDYNEIVKEYYKRINGLSTQLRSEYYGSEPLLKKVKVEGDDEEKEVPLNANELNAAYNKAFVAGVEEIKKDSHPSVIEGEEEFIVIWNEKFLQTEAQYFVYKIADTDYLPEGFVMDDLSMLDFMLP